MWLALQIALVVAFSACAAAAPWIGQVLKLNPPVIGAFTGALVGAAATMLGGLLARLATRADTASSNARRRAAIRTLISAELVNVAAGYMRLQQTLRAAERTLDVGGTVSTLQDFSNEMPRAMPLTSTLGAELIVLSTSEIDVLSTLISNMDLTRRRLEEFSVGKRSLDLLTIPSLSQEIAHDLDILAQAFERFAPSGRLAIGSQPPEPASVLLRRLAGELNAGR
jgi:hypothetical protein